MKKILTYSLNLKQIFPKIGFRQFLKNKNFQKNQKNLMLRFGEDLLSDRQTKHVSEDSRALQGCNYHYIEVLEAIIAV